MSLPEVVGIKSSRRDTNQDLAVFGINSCTTVRIMLSSIFEGFFLKGSSQGFQRRIHFSSTEGSLPCDLLFDVVEGDHLVAFGVEVFSIANFSILGDQHLLR